MNQVRWIALSLRYNQDHEILQTVIIYPEGENKSVKQEHTHHRRELLVPDGESFRLRQ